MEDDFVTIMTFTLPHEVAVIRARLESEGIECNVQNELTVQVYNFYSNAIGGIKLQVRERDCTRALEILKEAGYALAEEPETTEMRKKLDAVLLLIHNHWKKIILALTFIVALAYFTIPGEPPETLDVTLISNRWCLDRVVRKGKLLKPLTTGVLIVFNGECREAVTFRGDRLVSLPGINCAQVTGLWQLYDTSLVVHSIDTLKDIYEGIYRVQRSERVITLTSDSTVLVLSLN